MAVDEGMCERVWHLVDRNPPPPPLPHSLQEFSLRVPFGNPGRRRNPEDDKNRDEDDDAKKKKKKKK